MSELIARKRCKHNNQTGKFLSEACALIELVNIVDNFRLTNTKPCEGCIGKNCERYAYNKTKGYRREAVQASARAEARARACADDWGLSSRSKPTRHGASRQHGATRSNSAAVRCKTKSIESYPCPCTKLKEISKFQLEKQKPKIEKEINDMIREAKKNLKKQISTLSPKKVTNHHSSSSTATKEAKKQLLSSNLDMYKNLQMYSLNDLFALYEQYIAGKKSITKESKFQSINSLSRSNCSKAETKKKISNLSDSVLLNKSSIKRNTKKRSKANGEDSIISVVKKPSLHLMLNLHLKPNSNTMNLQIKSKRKASKRCTCGEPDVLSLRLPCPCDSDANRKRRNKMLIKKLSSNLSTTCAARLESSSVAQTSNEQKIRSLKKQIIRNSIRVPKTQAVYNVYDVTPYKPPGKMRGIKSHIYFNLDIGRGPKPESTMYTDDSRTIDTQSARLVGKPCRFSYKNKCNFNSRVSSLQQSVSLDRRHPEAENNLQSDVNSSQPCDCEPVETETGVSGAEESATCDTCCQVKEPELVVPYSKSSTAENILVSSLSHLNQTKKQLVNASYDIASIILSPRAFLNRLREKCRQIQSKVEAHQKNAGSCTCKPFRETDQFSIYEEGQDTGCSFLERSFGDLIYNDKCAVCSTLEKGSGTGRSSQSIKCTPGICVPRKPNIFERFTKICDKYKKDPLTKATQLGKRREKKLKKKLAQQKVKEEKKLEKERKKKEKELAKERRRREKEVALERKKRRKEIERARKQKRLEKRRLRKLKAKHRIELERARRGEESRTPFCKLITSMFKKSDDRKKLLKSKGKQKGHKGQKGQKGQKAGAKDADDGGGRVGETEIEKQARRGLRTGRRHFRKATKRIRDRYYRNKKLAEEQKGAYACDFYLLSLRNKPCLWVYYMCPLMYPYCLQLMSLWRQVTDLLLFFVAIIVWSPCILMVELLKVTACNLTCV